MDANRIFIYINIRDTIDFVNGRKFVLTSTRWAPRPFFPEFFFKNSGKKGLGQIGFRGVKFVILEKSSAGR